MLFIGQQPWKTCSVPLLLEHHQYWRHWTSAQSLLFHVTCVSSIHNIYVGTTLTMSECKVAGSFLNIKWNMMMSVFSCCFVSARAEDSLCPPFTFFPPALCKLVFSESLQGGNAYKSALGATSLNITAETDSLHCAATNSRSLSVFH